MSALAVALAVQVSWGLAQPAAAARAEDLRPPPSAAVVRLAAIGEPVALSKALMLWLQAFDWQTGTQVPYRTLNYAHVIAWLDRMIDLDPGGQYPLMAASRLYADIDDPIRTRQMIAFVERAFRDDPNQRWPWLAHVTLLAKHRLKDLPLARELAATLQRNTTAAHVPLWATQMEAFILEDMNEFEAARIMIGGLIASGQVKDERDALLLQRRLEALDAKLKGAKLP